MHSPRPLPLPSEPLRPADYIGHCLTSCLDRGEVPVVYVQARQGQVTCCAQVLKLDAFEDGTRELYKLRLGTPFAGRDVWITPANTRACSTLDDGHCMCAAAGEVA